MRGDKNSFSCCSDYQIAFNEYNKAPLCNVWMENFFVVAKKQLI
jgi:hypothetical protein